MNIFLLFLIPINKLALMAVFVALAGLYFFIHGLQLRFRARARKHTPEPDIRSASLGPVAVSGKATGPYTLPAPITGKPCYLYQTAVWQQTSPSRNWEKVAEEILHLPFFLEDSTGRLLIEPLGAELDLLDDFQEEYVAPISSPADTIPPRVNVFLALHGIVPGRPIRVEERSIQPATPVLIAGTITENPGIQVRPFSPSTGGSSRDRDVSPTDSIRSSNGNLAGSTRAPEVIKLSGSEAPTSTKEMTQQGKIAAALTRAGITKPEAWAAAGISRPEANSQNVAVEDRAHPAEELNIEPLAAGAGRPNGGRSAQPDGKTGFAQPAPQPFPPLVLMQDPENPTFLISCHSHPQLARSLNWQSVAMVIAGPFLIALGLYVLLLQWHTR